MYHSLLISSHARPMALFQCQKRLVFGTLLALVGYTIYCFSHSFITGDQPNIRNAMNAAIAGWAVWFLFAPFIASRVFYEGSKRQNPYTVLIRGLVWGIPLIFLALFFRGILQWTSGNVSIIHMLYYHLPVYTGTMVIVVAFAIWSWWHYTVQKALDSVSKPNRIPLEVLTGRGHTVIDAMIVDYMEANRNYIEVHAGNSRYLIRSTMKQLEKKLKGSPIVRTHRSYLVNINRISSINHNYGNHQLLLNNGEFVPVSRTYRDRVRVAMKCFPGNDRKAAEQ